MATIKDYLDNRKRDNADFCNRLNALEAKQAMTEQDVEANAEAIEDLAAIISAGGDE